MSFISHPVARAALRSLAATAFVTVAGAARAGNNGFEPNGIVADLLRWLIGG